MKHSNFATFFLLSLLSFVSGCAMFSPRTNELLPDVTYYDGPEKLSGKLFFLHATRSALNDPHYEKSAAIYEFDLGSKALRKVSDAPWGGFNVSKDGDLSCVTFSGPGTEEIRDTNVFIYSESMRQSRRVNFKYPPVSVVPVGGHVFFQLQVLPGPLVDFDVARGEGRSFEIPGASKWEDERYSSIRPVGRHTNLLQFHYDRSGERIENGRDYVPGYYQLDVNTGGLQKIPDLERRSAESVSFDGRHVFFTDSAGSFGGTDLVSSPLDQHLTRALDRKGKNVKLVHSFSMPYLAKGAFILRGISPCGHFALVMYMEGTRTGYARTYYLVDLANGHTRVLLRDFSECNQSGAMSVLHWVR